MMVLVATVVALAVVVFVGAIAASFLRRVWRARSYAAGPGTARLLGGIRSWHIGGAISIPAVALEIGAESSTFVVFTGSRSEHVVATAELELTWHGSRLDIVRHRPTGTRFWPRWTPRPPSTFLLPGVSPPALRGDPPQAPR